MNPSNAFTAGLTVTAVRPPPGFAGLGDRWLEASPLLLQVAVKNNTGRDSQFPRSHAGFNLSAKGVKAECDLVNAPSLQQYPDCYEIQEKKTSGPPIPLKEDWCLIARKPKWIMDTKEQAWKSSAKNLSAFAKDSAPWALLGLADAVTIARRAYIEGFRAAGLRGLPSSKNLRMQPWTFEPATNLVQAAN